MSMLRTVLGRPLTGTTRRHLTSAAGSETATSKRLLYLAGATAGAGVAYAIYTGIGSSSQEKPKQEKSPLDPQQFIDFRLKKIIPYNHNTSRFVFALPEGQASMLPVASCVLVNASDPDALKDDKGKPIIRPYTPVSHPDLPGEMHFLVKRYDAGNASQHIHSLKEGDPLAIKGPISKFPYKINEFEEVVLIGGGSGITPLYQILNYALPDQANKTKFKLIFANVSEKDILLREEFDAFRREYHDKFDVVYVLDTAPKGWKGETGYVSKEIVKKHVAPASVGEKVKIFVCGPPAQVAAVAGKKDGMKQGELGGILKELGYTSDQVFKF